MAVKQFLESVSQIARLHREASDLYSPRFAPDFRMFDFIEPDEMRLSKIFAWFLSPRGTHGQGGLFLSLFMETIELKAAPADCASACVETEVVTPQGRFDVLVSMDNFRLAIENKPWATDSENQIGRYLQHFDNSGLGQYHVVYLTKSGTAPPAGSLCEAERERRFAAQQLLLCAYDGEILTWLARCRAECRADRVSVFIDEFARYVRGVFQGVKDKVMSDHLLEAVTGSSDNVSAAMQVILLRDSILKKLLSTLGAQLAGALGRTPVLTDDAWARFSALEIAFSDRSQYKFSLEFQNTQYNGLIFGVRRPEQDNNIVGGEYRALVDKFGAGTQNQYWLWYRRASPTDPFLPLSPNWGMAAEPWIAIANGTLAPMIAKAFTGVREVLDQCGERTR